MLDSRQRRRERQTRRRLAALLVVLLVTLPTAWLIWRGTDRPTGSFRAIPPLLGQPGSVEVVLEGGRAGIASWQAYLRDAAGRRLVLAEERLPAGGWFGEGVRRQVATIPIDPAGLDLAEGPAELVLQAEGHAPLSRLGEAQPVASASFVVDRTAPEVRVLGGPHRIRQGGTGLVVYDTGTDAVASGVMVGDIVFPGENVDFGKEGRHAALYTIPWNAAPGVAVRLFAEDAAGNRRIREVPLRVRPRAARAEEIRVSDSFIRLKIYPLLEANNQPIPDSTEEAYLAVNRDMRAASETRLRELLADTAGPPRLLEGLRQQRGTKVGSRFAEHRTYTHKGKAIDEQTHLGYDLASVRQAPIETAGPGRVHWAGDLGIYGGAVLVDHGLGLVTLYAHLSSIEVAAGDEVGPGQIIGRSGETGLAGGDHLHFSTTLRGIHVDPIEWWDTGWVKREIASPLSAQGALRNGGS